MNRYVIIVIVGFSLAWGLSLASGNSNRALGDESALQQAGPLDEQLLRDVPPTKARTKGEPRQDEGEDISLVGPDEFLQDIRRRMKAVEQRMRGQDFSRSTQAEQGKIAAELESFIRQLQQQQRAGGRDKTGGSGQASDTTGGAQQATKGPAVESSHENDAANAAGDETAKLQSIMPGVWGNLSPQMRQQIQNLTGEKFLPQYERLIQQYYRRLAESPKP